MLAERGRTQVANAEEYVLRSRQMRRQEEAGKEGVTVKRYSGEVGAAVNRELGLLDNAAVASSGGAQVERNASLEIC